MKAEERNALFLLLGIGVTGAIIYARNSKAAEPERPLIPDPSDRVLIEPGEEWIVDVRAEGAPFVPATGENFREMFKDTAELLSFTPSGDYRNARIALRFIRKASLPPLGTNVGGVVLVYREWVK